MDKIYVGDIGTTITLDYGLDTSTAIERVIRARKPSGTIKEWPATSAVVNGETTGLAYTTEADDLDEDGVWRLQTHCVLTSGAWSGETTEMRVSPLYG